MGEIFHGEMGEGRPNRYGGGVPPGPTPPATVLASGGGGAGGTWGGGMDRGGVMAVSGPWYPSFHDGLCKFSQREVSFNGRKWAMGSATLLGGYKSAGAEDQINESEGGTRLAALVDWKISFYIYKLRIFAYSCAVCHIPPH